MSVIGGVLAFVPVIAILVFFGPVGAAVLFGILTVGCLIMAREHEGFAAGALGCGVIFIIALALSFVPIV